ncbi:DUF4937 domain-containing protein [Streptomyces sp. NPDC059917]|uniref:DUF4937 domain-containing protein n=1 Tax=Streptomyces sp. NPDC059917 TaxID=3347002 RepID=UPI003654F17A
MIVGVGEGMGTGGEGLGGMWGKWIGCGVPEGAREGFSAGQRAWAVIGDQPGLVGQVGGWDAAGGRAHVLGLWEDVEAYGRFMDDRHDEVFAGSGQAGSCTGIETAGGESVLEMAGDAADLAQALEDATLLRVADCRLVPGREEHFMEVQREVWAPGMAAGGMLAGVVTGLGGHRYLVTTLWSGPEAHERYAAAHLPALLTRAGLREDLRSTTGHLIPLEPSWRVLPVAAPPVRGG